MFRILIVAKERQFQWNEFGLFFSELGRNCGNIKFKIGRLHFLWIKFRKNRRAICLKWLFNWAAWSKKKTEKTKNNWEKTAAAADTITRKHIHTYTLTHIIYHYGNVFTRWISTKAHRKPKHIWTQFGFPFKLHESNLQAIFYQQFIIIKHTQPSINGTHSFD